MKRRVLLAGVGLSSIGVGAAFGSGAFTTIEANRNVELNVNGDDSAQILFEKGGGTGAERLIGTDESNAVDVIEFSQTNLNEQSKTTFENALKITNNTNGNGDGLNVDFYVQDDDGIGNSDSDPLDFRFDDGSSEFTIVSSTNSIELKKGNTKAISIIVDLRDDEVNSGSNDLTDIGQITFVVEAIDGN